MNAIPSHTHENITSAGDHRYIKGSAMTELVQQREILRSQGKHGAYRSLVNVLVERTGRSTQKVLRRGAPPPFWISAVVFALLIYCLFLLIVLLSIFQQPLTVADQTILFGGLILVPVLLIIMAFSESVHKQVIEVCSTYIADVLESTEALQSFKTWLLHRLNIGTQAVTVFTLGTIVGIVTILSFYAYVGAPIHIGAVLAGLLISILGAAYVCTSLTIMGLPRILSKHSLRLNTFDPSESETIEKISGLLNNNIVAIGVYAAFLTFTIWFFGAVYTDFAISLLAIQVSAIVIIFANGQYYLVKLIKNAKRQKLNEIQTKIENLEYKGDITEKETREAIQWLIDYYDRIKRARNSALDIGAVLRFLQSLLLPLLASLLTNISEIMKFFSP